MNYELKIQKGDSVCLYIRNNFLWKDNQRILNMPSLLAELERTETAHEPRVI